ncbi:MAG: S8 family serine peptidase [Bacteroidetes bacterium]|jgi:subtilisin family serine protease|nr:S8 family serine peptidase [Bacteroidota bacterium]
MIYVRLFQRYAVLTLLALGLGLLTGCTDSLLTAPPTMESTEPAAEAPDANKLRYAHLMKGANGANKRVLERYEDLLTDTDFILGLSDTVLEPQRVLERYDDESDITVRRSFEAAQRGFSVRIKEGELDDFLEMIEEDDDIEWVEPDPTVRHKKASDDDTYAWLQHTPWAVRRVSDALRAHGDNADQVHVFVLDSGIESTDLNVCETRSFLDEAIDGDKLGHGTHIAGTIGAKDNFKGVLGVAPNACLHDYRVMQDNGDTELSTVVDAVDHITALKQANPDWPMVVNISLGVDVGLTQYNALDEAIQASIDAGVTYIVAAGNDGIDASTVTPAHVEDAITVGAHDAQLAMADFSNHGALVDLMAPGVDILSLPNSLDDAGHMVRLSGTSMAAGHVSGLAALLLAGDPTLSPDALRSALLAESDAAVQNAPSGTTGQTPFVGTRHAFEDVNNNGVYDAGYDIAVTDADILDGQYKADGDNGLVIPAGLGPITTSGDLKFESKGDLVVEVDLSAKKIELRSHEGELKLPNINATTTSEEIKLEARWEIDASGAALTAPEDFVDISGDDDLYLRGAELTAQKEIRSHVKGDIIATYGLFTSETNRVELKTDGRYIELDGAVLMGSDHLTAEAKGDFASIALSGATFDDDDNTLEAKPDCIRIDGSPAQGQVDNGCAW